MENSLQKTSNTGGSKHYIMLTKDRKPISRTLCDCAPDGVPSHWSLGDFVQRTKIHSLPSLPRFGLYPAGENSRDRKEWQIFLRYIMNKDMVAISKSEFYEFYIFPPIEALESSHTCVAYKMVKPYPVDASMLKSENYGLLHPTVNSHMDAILVPPLRASPAPHLHFEEPARRVDLTTSEETGSSKFSPSFGDHPQVSNIENNGRPKPHVLK
ncbi:uncharacterized protein LOC132799275 isoform X1 [Ziziphus jujuba]|uniref:Uncharacterized protein LOC132799275 isoform X1 n=1 Tax=Ziziphus jujuba TaxID=326968 RepID=A0A6P4ATV2_ZIZJJ|nr:uncharacterized protein LOC132799275 isoform X1 [Ziziphus jujuba]XP_060674780.1 uncharacterized protein LOC132799275 isoform X1 [Ziziphus jujuba]XP_060674781.1 uncharacterized protein LOC132799275 isoform X1 [Ziziphus jujuba]